MFLKHLISAVFILTATNVLAQNSSPVKEGEYTKYYTSGKIKYTGQFKDSKPFGVFKYYFETGEIQSVLDHISENEVKAVHYYQTGEKMAEGVYLNRKKQGIWKTYGAKEVLVEEGNYISGKKYEKWKTFYPDGKLSQELFFKNDLEEGPFKKYFENGKLMQEGTYTSGYRQGKTTYYYPDGTLNAKGQYEKDTRDGVWTYFDEKGNEFRKIEFDKGRRLTPLFEDEEIEDMELFKHQVKDELEYEDMEGTIKYNERK